MPWPASTSTAGHERPARTLERRGSSRPVSSRRCGPTSASSRAAASTRFPDEDLEQAFTGVFRGVLSEETRFLGGETIGALFDRVLPALERLLADESWDVLLAVLHGGRQPRDPLVRAHGRAAFLGQLRAGPACVNVLDAGADHWVVRAVNLTPYDLPHLERTKTTMEQLYSDYVPYRKED